MKKVYFISGLGADRRVFEFLDLSFCEPVFLDWISPMKNESLPAYAARLCAGVKEPDATLVGMSLGGMMATEFAKTHPGAKVIILASNKTSKEFPGYLRFLLKYFPLYRLTSRSLLLAIMPVILWFLGAKTEHQKKLLRNVVMETDIPFIKWSIGAVAKWKSKEIPPNVTHIHGTADRILPYKYVKPHYTIQDGEHLMIKTKPKELSDLLRTLCLQ
jgi:pimeloyl-ACP methyl ester carboxylesterase